MSKRAFHCIWCNNKIYKIYEISNLYLPNFINCFMYYTGKSFQTSPFGKMVKRSDGFSWVTARLEEIPQEFLLALLLEDLR